MAPTNGILRRLAPTVGLLGLTLLGVSCSKREKPADRQSPAPVTAPAVRARPFSGSNGVPWPVRRARDVAEKLGKKHFLIGMGNDLDDNHDKDGAYTLGPQLDVHYAYLVGLAGRPDGWPEWLPDGEFVTVLAETARKHGVIPMFTLYSMAGAGEGKVEVLQDAKYMKGYLDAARLLFQRLGDFGDPSIVHLEPDFWGFMQRRDPDPKQIEAQVEAHAPECVGLGDTLAGLGRCLVRMARRYSPKTLVGFHASAWAHGDPKWIAFYLQDVGAREADLVVVEMLDRDAGCFEAKIDPNCQRDDGPWYWDETNRTSPNFREHLSWAAALSEALQKPLLWWQLPFGVPSDKPGGKPGQYRDNRVKYLFEHVHEFVEAGGLGALFGVGAANQTYVTTDGGQFKRAVEKYRAAPVLLGNP